MKPCDCITPPFPPTRRILPGQSPIPRKWASYAQVRREFKKTLADRGLYKAWRPGSDDLSVLLVELWAYVSDVLATYDMAIATESYLGSARLAEHIRQHAALTGYTPRPATAAQAVVELLLEPETDLQLTQPLSFLATPKGPGKPVTFHSGSEGSFNAAWNSMPVVPNTRTSLRSSANRIAVVQGSTTLTAGDWVAIYQEAANPTGSVEGKDFFITLARVTEVQRGTNGTRDTTLVLSRNLPDPSLINPERTQILAPNSSIAMWPSTDATRLVPRPATEDGPVNNFIALNGAVPSITTGSNIMVTRGSVPRWYTVRAAEVITVFIRSNGTVLSQQEFLALDKPPNTIIPNTITVAVLETRGRDASNFDILRPAFAQQLRVHYDIVPAAEPAFNQVESYNNVSTLNLDLPDSARTIRQRPERLFLQDTLGGGTFLPGAFDPAAKTFSPQFPLTVSDPLNFPRSLRGNMLDVTEGEPVLNETLGDGNPALSSQAFTLSRKPLTFLPSTSTATPHGFASTLTIHINGEKWQEVPSFYGIGPREKVYTVSVADDGEATVTFGDGINGALLPRGRGNVVASYSVGAGATGLSVGTINQLIKGAKGVASVTNLLAAAEGSSPEPAKETASNAPAAIITRGRIVSLRDYEAVVARIPGVRTSRVEKTWNARAYQSQVVIWYMGEDLLHERIDAQLAGRTEVGSAFVLRQATSIPFRIILDVDYDADFDAKQVRQSIIDHLLLSETAVLRPENIGIGRPLIRSRVAEALHDLPGVLGIRHLAVSFQDTPTDILIKANIESIGGLLPQPVRLNFDRQIARNTVEIQTFSGSQFQALPADQLFDRRLALSQLVKEQDALPLNVDILLPGQGSYFDVLSGAFFLNGEKVNHETE